MVMQHSVRKVAVGVVLACALAGCQPIAAPSGGNGGTGTPTASTLPATESEEESEAEAWEVWYVEAGSAHDSLDLRGEDAAVAQQLDAVLGSVNAQARTFFDAARFAAEVESLPHVRVRYAEIQEFEGQGIRWQATELVLVAVIQGDGTGEPMVLARTGDEGDWSVYLPAEGEPLRELIEAVGSRSQ